MTNRQETFSDATLDALAQIAKANRPGGISREVDYYQFLPMVQAILVAALERGVVQLPVPQSSSTTQPKETTMNVTPEVIVVTTSVGFLQSELNHQIAEVIRRHAVAGRRFTQVTPIVPIKISDDVVVASTTLTFVDDLPPGRLPIGTVVHIEGRSVNSEIIGYTDVGLYVLEHKFDDDYSWVDRTGEYAPNEFHVLERPQ